MYGISDYGGGARSGYPKKAKSRNKNDFVISGALQVDFCPLDNWCNTNYLTPEVAITGIKYRF